MFLTPGKQGTTIFHELLVNPSIKQRDDYRLEILDLKKGNVPTLKDYILLGSHYKN